MSRPDGKYNNKRVNGSKAEDPRIKQCTICENDYHPYKSQDHTYCNLCYRTTELFKAAALEETQEAYKKVTEKHKPTLDALSQYETDEEWNVEAYMEASRKIQGEAYRDVEGKPPRHYYYSPAIQELLIEADEHDAATCVRILDTLLLSLQEDTGIAHWHIKTILNTLTDMYGPELVIDVSYVVKMGAVKYGHSNYRNGMRFSLCISSFMGHLLKHSLLGQEKDEESGYSHLLHCAANMMMLLGYVEDPDIVDKYNDIKDM